MVFKISPIYIFFSGEISMIGRKILEKSSVCSTALRVSLNKAPAATYLGPTSTFTFSSWTCISQWQSTVGKLDCSLVCPKQPPLMVKFYSGAIPWPPKTLSWTVVWGSFYSSLIFTPLLLQVSYLPHSLKAFPASLLTLPSIFHRHFPQQITCSSYSVFITASRGPKLIQFLCTCLVVHDYSSLFVGVYG